MGSTRSRNLSLLVLGVFSTDARQGLGAIESELVVASIGVDDIGAIVGLGEFLRAVCSLAEDHDEPHGDDRK